MGGKSFQNSIMNKKGFPSTMKHTPMTPSHPEQGTPLINQVLSFFETLLAAHSETGTSPKEALPRPRRGHPETLSFSHLWLACLLGIFRQAKGIADVWRLLTLGPLGTFASIQISQQGVRQRLLHAGLDGVAHLLEQVNAALWAQENEVNALPLASFAPHVVALDESTLEAVARLCDDVRHLPSKSPVLLAGKLAGLFDLRRQQWVRLQFRSDAAAHCRVGAFLLLEGLQKGSLILADLGYFSFAGFDYLTDQGYYWISRLKPRVSFERLHVFFEQGQTLDAMIWLGVHRSDQAAHAVRLIQFCHGDTLYQYVTNVCDPHLLPMCEVAQLYARRWDIELAFKLLKCHLGLHFWWACDPLLVMQQIYFTLIVAQVLHHLQLSIATVAQVDPFDVSLPTLLTLLTEACWPCPAGLVTTLAQKGRFHKLIRPHQRVQMQAPCIDPQQIKPLPDGIVLQRRARRCPSKTPVHPRSTSPLDFRLLPRFLI
jgi:hypothetical protein